MMMQAYVKNRVVTAIKLSLIVFTHTIIIACDTNPSANTNLRNNETMNTFISATETTITSGEDTLLVTLEDAKKIRYALADYLEDNKEALESSIPEALIGGLYAPLGPAIIDPKGLIRIGAWILEARNGQLMLAIRPIPFQPNKVNYRCKALLTHTETNIDDPWQVTEIELEKNFLTR